MEVALKDSFYIVSTSGNILGSKKSNKVRKLQLNKINNQQDQAQIDASYRFVLTQLKSNNSTVSFSIMAQDGHSLSVLDSQLHDIANLSSKDLNLQLSVPDEANQWIVQPSM